MRFRTCKNFWEQQTASLVLSQKFLQIQKPHRHYFDCDSLHESKGKIFRHCEANRRFAEAIQNKNVDCHDFASQNLAMTMSVKIINFNTKEHK